MKIGIAGPIATDSVAKHLAGDISSLPTGMAGAPLLGTLISALIARGHQVSAYTLDKTLQPSLNHPIIAEGESFKIYYGAYRPHAFRTNRKDLGRMLDFFRIERRAIEEAIRIDRPDVVHGHWTYEFSLAAIASGFPHIVTCHDSPLQVLRFMPNLYRFGRYLMAREVFRKAKRLSVVSPYLKTQLERYASEPIAVIPNPIPFSLPEEFSTRRTIADRASPNIAMILNGWGGLKNPKPALEAFSILRRTIPGAKLHLFGFDFGSGEKAQLWALSRGMAEGVIFHGPTAHELLLCKLRTMDLLLHPALEESFGMVLIEAMALGLPVVAGDKSGGVPWVLGDGNAGILTDVRSPDAICCSLLRILQNATEYEEIVRAGRERVSRLFTPAVVAMEYEKMYLSAIASGN